ncbi:hypothetical protein EJD97_025406 [Solanum chilense]|uniref:Uncharacterized protein n=1 Tax=Solanum chilense TaxID=4083 RepID=A0A6N2ARD0_SOLCI|nr:hypothetical protein EJD97_025406 [Solanum chilense]
MDDSVAKENVGTQFNSSNSNKATVSHKHMDCATIDYAAEKQKVSSEDVTKNNSDHSIVSPKHTNFTPVDDVAETAMEVGKQAEDVMKDSISSISFTPENEAMTLDVNQLDAVIPLQLTWSDDLLSDSQLPSQLGVSDVDTKTPSHRNRMPSKVLQSPQVHSFESTDKGNDKIDDHIRSFTLFDDCRITSSVSPDLMQEFLHWIKKGLLKSHANKINWLSLEAYKDKETGELLGPQHSFTVEYAQEIMQQQNDSLCLCRIFERQIKISSVGLQSDYLRNRYRTLLLKYGMDKHKDGYVSHNDDPTKPKGEFSKQAEDAFVDVD